MGARVRRVEDKSFVTGAGRYTDDHTPPGTLRAFMLRSAVAHARITVGNLEAARAMPDVRLILTHADIADYGGVPCKIKLTNIDGTRMKTPKRPMLIGDVVRHVGDPIAFVVADDLESARMAAEAISVDYETLDPVVDMKAALEPSAPVIWPEFGENVAFRVDKGDKAATDAAFAGAARVTRMEIVNNRVVANYMETRGVIAEFDPATGRYTLTQGSQGGHSVRDIIAKAS